MIITKDVKTGTWLDLVEEGSYKKSFLLLFGGKPPKFSEFYLTGYKDLDDNKSINMSLSIVSPKGAVKLWPTRSVNTVTIDFRLQGVDFYVTNLWREPGAKQETREMKEMVKQSAFICINGPMSSGFETITITGITPSRNL